MHVRVKKQIISVLFLEIPLSTNVKAVWQQSFKVFTGWKIDIGSMLAEIIQSSGYERCFSNSKIIYF